MKPLPRGQDFDNQSFHMLFHVVCVLHYPGISAAPNGTAMAVAFARFVVQQLEVFWRTKNALECCKGLTFKTKSIITLHVRHSFQSHVRFCQNKYIIFQDLSRSLHDSGEFCSIGFRTFLETNFLAWEKMQHLSA